MSPQRANPAPHSHAPSSHRRPRQSHTRSRTPTSTPNQPTIWQFIRPLLPTTLTIQALSTTQQSDQISEIQEHNRQQQPEHGSSSGPNTQTDENGLDTQTPQTAATPMTPPNILRQAEPQSQEFPTLNLQTPLHIDKTNDGWGDLHHYSCSRNHFRVISKNVSTLNPYSLEMVAMATELQTMQASIFCIQETNTAWTPKTLLAFKNQCRPTYPYHKLAVSSSKEKNDDWFQPGGTATIALDKWASRVINWGSDDILGRWSYLEMVGQDNKRVIIASAYRVCPQEFDATANTSTAQQTRLLQQHGIPTPNPRQQFITDLIQQIKKWCLQNKEILICMDANEDVSNPKSQISRLFLETDLVDIHHYRYPTIPRPATHQRGSLPIDMMIGTTLFATAATAAWMLPFGDPPLIKGDHRILGADFHPGILFGSTPDNPASNTLRGINSRHEQHVIQYCEHVVKQCNAHRLAERIGTLFTKISLEERDLVELESIDTKLTKILVQADQRLRPLSSVPWSPAVKQAYLLHRYWVLTRTAKRNHHNLSDALNRIKNQLENNAIDLDPQVSLSTKL